MKYKTDKLVPLLFICGLILVVIAYWVGQKPLEEDQTPRSGDEYHIPIPGRFSSWNPKTAVWVYEKDLLNLVFDPLLVKRNGHKFAPSLCENWSLSPDAETFQCRIRSGVKFHDGLALQPQDAVFSLNFLMQKDALDAVDFRDIVGIENYWDGSAKTISGISHDGENLIIQFDNANPNFPEVLASKRMVVLPDNFRGKSENDFFISPIGTGPFIPDALESETVKLKSFPDYFDGKPFVSSMRIDVKDVDAAIEGFNKEIYHDLRYYDIPLEKIRDDIAQFVPSTSYATVILFPSSQHPPFDKKVFRELLYAAFDIHQTLKACGFQGSETTSLVPSGIPGHEDDPKWDRYDFSLAREILINLDIKTIPEAKILYSPDAFRSCIAEKTNANFKKLSLPWLLKPISTSDLAKEFFDGKSMAHLEGLEVKNEDAFSVLKYFDSHSLENLSRISDSGIDAMLDEVKNTSDTERRTALYKLISRSVAENAYAFPLMETGNTSVFQKSVRIYQRSLDSRYAIDFSKVWLDKGSL